MKAHIRAATRVAIRYLRCAAAVVPIIFAPAATAHGQGPGDLDSLIRQALAVNSGVRNAAARVEAARERVSPAASWPDPMLMLGVMNVPVGGMVSPAHGASAGPDPMRMNVVGIQQTVPFPGKLSLARRAAEHRLREAEAELAGARLAVTSQVRQAYYDIAFGTRALEVVERNARVLASLMAASEARYVSAGGAQVEVLNARVEATRLGETATELIEARREAIARLNALLERASDTPVSSDFPPALLAAAAPDSPAHATFVSTALGARAAGSPLKSQEELQALALDSSAVLMLFRARAAAEQAGAELAAREYLPDITGSLEYSQRMDLPDMVSAGISLPIPIFKRRKQDRLAAAARADVAAAEAAVTAAEQDMFGRIAGIHADLERQRSRLALYVGALIPQAQATVHASLAGFQSGRTSLFELLGHQAALFRYETEYFRAVTDFGRSLAELEQLVGAEVLR